MNFNMSKRLPVKFFNTVVKFTAKDRNPLLAKRHLGHIPTIKDFLLQRLQTEVAWVPIQGGAS